MSRCFVFLLSWVGWLGWLRRGGEGTKGGGKERRKRASSAPWFSAKSWGYSAFQYILPELTPKTNRCASRFATTASALRASAAPAVRRGAAEMRRKRCFPHCNAFADRALAPCHTQGSRNARVREQAPQRANALQHCRTLCAASGTLPPPFLDGRKSVVSTARATCEHRRRLRSRIRTGNPRSQGWPDLATCATGASTDATEDGATSISIDNG